MKGYLLGTLSGLVISWAYVAAANGPQKLIDWRPADRYEMTVAADGNVWRLDKATGTIHVVCGNRSFDIPEQRSNDE